MMGVGKGRLQHACPLLEPRDLSMVCGKRGDGRKASFGISGEVRKNGGYGEGEWRV